MQKLLRHCLTLSAEVSSRDLHFIPEQDEVLVMRRLMDTRMELLFTMNHERFEQFSRYLKFQANLQLGVRLLQCGQFHYDDAAYECYLRCSFVPTPRGESIVIRILDQSAIRNYEQLTPIKTDQQALANISRLQQGLVIFSGPTGVGKTTTLYALMEHCKQLGRSIVSLEDPVERQIYGITQIQIHEASGVSYESALQTTLRHDPDVIVIGEIRSEHVMKMAKRAALTGHLVIATVHSGSVHQCFERLRDLGVTNHELEATLRFISTQQLVVNDEHVYGIYEYLESEQLETWFTGVEVEYVRLAEKMEQVFTQTNHI
ncbi:MAG: ATPase, T2SS/T4P/T4SS family [Culicoidibacterales bacterium]